MKRMPFREWDQLMWSLLAKTHQAQALALASTKASTCKHKLEECEDPEPGELSFADVNLSSKLRLGHTWPSNALSRPLWKAHPKQKTA